MDSLKAAEEQRPTFTFSGCHHLLELSNLPNNHLTRCSVCTLPIHVGRDCYYTCRPCSFSLCSSHPPHELSLKFHAECSSITSAVATAQNSPNAGSLPQPTPSTAYKMPHQESTLIQLQQLTPSIVIGIGPNLEHPQFDGSRYQQPVGNGIRASQPRPQVTGGGYLNTVTFPSIRTTVPDAPGTGKGAGVGIGTPVMAGVGSGIEEGTGQELILSSSIGFGHRFFRLLGSGLTPTNSWEHRLLYPLLCFSVFLFVYLGYSTELSIWNQ